MYNMGPNESKVSYNGDDRSFIITWMRPDVWKDRINDWIYNLGHGQQWRESNLATSFTMDSDRARDTEGQHDTDSETLSWTNCHWPGSITLLDRGHVIPNLKANSNPTNSEVVDSTSSPRSVQSATYHVQDYLFDYSFNHSLFRSICLSFANAATPKIRWVTAI